MSKITKEELSEVKEIKGKLTGIQLEIGRYELLKNEMLQAFNATVKQMEEAKLKLSEKYGDVSINLEDGTYEEIEKEAE